MVVIVDGTGCRYGGPLVNFAALVSLGLVAADLTRMAELVRQYIGFPLDVADASVIAVAERLKAREVAALDQRHFRAVTPAHITALTLLP